MHSGKMRTANRYPGDLRLRGGLPSEGGFYFLKDPPQVQKGKHE